MRSCVKEEICNPSTTLGDDLEVVIDEIRQAGGFGSNVETSTSSEEAADEVCTHILIGDVSCPVEIAELPAGSVETLYTEGDYSRWGIGLPEVVRLQERVSELEPPTLEGDGKGLNKRERLRVHAKFVARATLVLRAKLGRLTCEPANQLVVSKEYSRMLRKPEYNLRAVDVESHRRDVINAYFSDLPFEAAPLVRSRLPLWFKDLFSLEKLEDRPLAC